MSNYVVDEALEAAFGSVAAAKKKGAARLPRLTKGTHTVVIKGYQVKNTQAKGKMFRAELLVLESTDPNSVDTTRDQPWFPGADRWGKQDEQARAFLDAAQACVGTDEPIQKFAAHLAGPQQLGRGIRMKAVVSDQIDNKTGKPKLNPETNEPYTNTTWYAIPQTFEEIVQCRNFLDSKPEHAMNMDTGPAPQAVAPPATFVAPAPVAQAPVVPAAVAQATATTGSALLGLLGKK